MGSNKFEADVTLTAFTSVLIAAIGIVTGIATARLLGPIGRGELAAIQTTSSALASLSMVGMAEALVYFSAQIPRQASRLLGTAIMIAVSAALPTILLGYIGLPVLLRVQSHQVIEYARYNLLIALVFATTGMMYHPLRGTGDFRSWNGLRLAVPLLQVLVITISYVSGWVSAEFIAMGYLAAFALLGIPCAFIVSQRLGGLCIPDKHRVIPMIRFGIPCMMAGLPQTLNLRLDQMLMAAILPARDLGFYVVAVAWSGAMSPILSAIGATLLPAVASAPDDDVAAARISHGVRMTATLAIGLCSLGVLAAPIAIPLMFGSRFAEAIVPAMILVPSAGLLGLNLSLQECLRGLGRPYLVLRAELIGLVVTLTALAATLRPWGIIGAAVASFSGYLTVTIALLAAATVSSELSIRELIMPRANEIGYNVRRILSAAKSISL